MNIVQKFLLEKRFFSYSETPMPHYKKIFYIREDINIVLILIFKDYEVIVNRYLYFGDKYCGFELDEERRKRFQNITDLFDFITKYDSETGSEVKNLNFAKYKQMAYQKITLLEQETQKLLLKVTAMQRAKASYENQTADKRTYSQQINLNQKQINRNKLEIETLTKLVQAIDKLNN